MILLQASGREIFNLLLWPAVFAIMYFSFIRPNQKKQKEQVAFQEELSKGTEVVTASGIIGKISKIEDQIVTLQVDQKTYMRVTKNAISKEMTDSVLGNNG